MTVEPDKYGDYHTEHAYIFQLPATVIWDLAAILDVGAVWEDVAARMPEITDLDIDGCRRLKNGQKPTEMLLKIWGSIGYHTLDLFRIFLDLQLVRCMRILKPYVDEIYHFVIEESVVSEMGKKQKVCLPAVPLSPHYPSVSNQNSLMNHSHRCSSMSGAKSPEYGGKQNVNSSLEDSKKKTNSIGSQVLSSAASSEAVASSAPSESSSVIAGLQNTPSVKYEDILEATNNFAADKILGRGGYGVVYKGVWKHTEVAIKRIQGRNDNSLEHQKERIRQSLQELRTLAKFRHDNVLSLYGYSMDGAEPCLIYQFMSNGSLEDRLLCRNGSEPFNWPTKLSICKGVSCGLHFLHSVTNAPIIHGDLGDFGLSRDGQVELDGLEKKPMIASHIKGTLAYLPPEFTTSKVISTKLDVYSFGGASQPGGLHHQSMFYSGSQQSRWILKVFGELADKRTPSGELSSNQIDQDAQVIQLTVYSFLPTLLLSLCCFSCLYVEYVSPPKNMHFSTAFLRRLFYGSNIHIKDVRQLSEQNVVISDHFSSDIPLKIIRVGMDRDAENSTGKGKEASKRKITHNMGSCKIPHLDKDRPEVMKFMKRYAPLRCAQKNGLDWLEIDDDRRIQLTTYAKKIVNLAKLNCTWRFFDRLSDTKLTWFDEKKFAIGDKIQPSDFFEAHCKEGKLRWDGVFMTVVPKLDKLKKLKTMKKTSSWSGLNVYILGFDSLSQMAFRRSLPETTEYLEKVMKSVVFNGYNIVGDGTPQAYIPFLTGQTEEELPLTRKRFPNAHFVDDVYPFAWTNFSKAGYATLYGEDSHAIGTFTYRLKGFRKQPTDHFTPPFFQHFEKTCGSWVCPCIGSIPQHQIWFKYAERFWKEYSEVPRFLLLHHSSLSHDDINKVQVADIDLRDHLKRQFESGAFENTLVVVMADHGHRFTKLRETHQGQLEERLPFSLPSYHPNLPQILASNQPSEI
uniref:Protein kinase domain-containing protein n=1 Tax=Ditylenchus dipsaci TaxID=166011 RepID=A0A915EAU1_9BILA